MTITDIYDKFRINKGLREHMLRVASVAQVICDNSITELDTKNIVHAALVHDLGNIVKTNFEFGAELFAPEGVTYYRNVQQEVIEKYGSDDHEVTLAMLAEINTPKTIVKTMSATGLKIIPEIVAKGTILEKIMLYADLRVGMCGIITLDARFEDLDERYVPGRYTTEIIETGRSMMKEIEGEIFAHSKISSVDITDGAIGNIQEKLLHVEIETTCPA